MTIYVMAGLLSIVFIIIVSSLALVFLMRLFKIGDFRYKNSLVVSIVFFLGYTVLADTVIPLALHGLMISGYSLMWHEVLSLALVFVAFYFFFKKYYQSSFKQTLGVYVAFIAVVWFSTFVTYYARNDYFTQRVVTHPVPEIPAPPLGF